MVKGYTADPEGSKRDHDFLTSLDGRTTGAWVIKFTEGFPGERLKFARYASRSRRIYCKNYDEADKACKVLESIFPMDFVAVKC
jgi:hypothetical protein